MNIQPVSELRNYNNVLDEVKEGEPVLLTKNGKGAFAIIDIKDIEAHRKLKAYVSLFDALVRGRKSEYMSYDEFLEKISI